MVDRLVGTEENNRRILNVENCFGISGVPLQNDGRVLVGEGVLKKMCRKKLKPRQMFLFNDILVYGSIVIRNKKYTRQHIIPLENVKIEDLSDDDPIQFGWLIRTPTKSFAVYAASLNEKREWINHINMCIKDLLDRSDKKPISEHAAVWIPDDKSDVCMVCKKTQFTVLNRKHHCRNCGKIVCGSCSRNRNVLVNISTKPVRVCDACFVELTNKNSQTNPNGNSENKLNSPSALDESSDSDSEMRDKSGLNRDSGRSLEELNIIDQPTFYSKPPQNA